MHFSQAEALRLGFARMGAKQEEQNRLFPLFYKDIERIETDFNQTLRSQIDYLDNEIMPLFQSAKERGDYFQNEFESALRDRDEYTERLLERQTKKHEEEKKQLEKAADEYEKQVKDVTKKSLAKIQGMANENTILQRLSGGDNVSPWGIYSKGTLSVYPNYRSVIRELEKSEPYGNLIEKLVHKDEQAEFFSGKKKLYDDTYLAATRNPGTKKKSDFDTIFRKVKKEDPNKVLELSFGNTKPLKGLVFGEDDNLRALFKIKE